MAREKLDEKILKNLVSAAPEPRIAKEVKYKQVVGKNVKIEHGRSDQDVLIHIFARKGIATYNKGETLMVMKRIEKFIPKQLIVDVLPPRGAMAPMYSFILRKIHLFPADVERLVGKIVTDLTKNL